MTAVATDPGAAAPPATTLSARPAERLERARASSSLTGVNRWIAFGAAMLLHLAILGPIWLQFDWQPQAAPPSEEIPVEIVVEQPKPPPQPQPQPSNEPALPKPPIDLEPAHDAPRGEASDDKTPRYGDTRPRTPRRRLRPISRKSATRRRRATPPSPSSRLRIIRRRRRTTTGRRRRATTRSRSPSRRRQPPRPPMRRPRWRR